ncbi:UNVERIFIED_CONTAM: hypothetical protein Sradi_0491100 [Sesamum radiatum]|uniref:Uncharacterized protein n=1 Tax=Sesamum radiatum TaxID=300843 RepID=A0AAW2W7I1_SESRA
MSEIERVSPKVGSLHTAYGWLSEVPTQHWARCLFPSRIKCDTIVNNLSEYFNNYILEATINYHRLNIEDYVDMHLKKETNLKVYSHMINPVPGMHDFEESTLGKVTPPSVKSKMGREKQVRRRDANDIRYTGRVSRNGLRHTCGTCLRTGHNKRSCLNHPHPNSRETQIPVPNSQNPFSQSESLFPLDEFSQSQIEPLFSLHEMPEIFQRLRRPSFTQPTTSMQSPTFVPPRSSQFSSPFQPAHHRCRVLNNLHKANPICSKKEKTTSSNI